MNFNYGTQRQFFSLVGKTISSLVVSDDNEEVRIVADDRLFVLKHIHDCCECVEVKKIIGSISDLIGEPLILAEEDNRGTNCPEWDKETGRESFTWADYVLATKKGRVEIWVLGESNGYYGETMEFDEVSQ